MWIWECASWVFVSLVVTKVIEACKCENGTSMKRTERTKTLAHIHRFSVSHENNTYFRFQTIYWTIIKCSSHLPYLFFYNVYPMKESFLDFVFFICSIVRWHTYIHLRHRFIQSIKPKLCSCILFCWSQVKSAFLFFFSLLEHSKAQRALLKSSPLSAHV